MSQTEQAVVTELRERLDALSIEQGIQALIDTFPEKVVFASSFSAEDQVITHVIVENRLPVGIFTLDTGRLFSETYAVWQATQERYGTTIRAYAPRHEQVEELLKAQGPNGFYHSRENRMACCHIRKVQPLQRALHGQSVWITGLRAEHSLRRQQLPSVEWDEAHRVIKYHPLLRWTAEQVRQFIDDNNIPNNALYRQGFSSIGCAPCTRVIQPGESSRAGRWWWEHDDKKECGLHSTQP